MDIHLSYIVLCPLLGSLLSFAAGARRPQTSGWIATAAAALSFVCTKIIAITLGSDILDGRLVLDETVFEWISAGSLTVPFALRMDSLSLLMCSFVTGVSTLIHLYSIGYMAEDPSKPRFFAYLNLFLFSMLLLVLGSNLPVLFIGWEGVGLCSYLLIGFWFTNEKFAAAGRKAFVVNRIGDAGLLLGMFLIMRRFGSLDFYAIHAAMPAVPDASLMTAIALCLFAGAVGKSAQIPLFVWLPDAMAGPTPVSALIHAATMVTAGVYLLARSSFIFTAAPEAMFVVTLIALLTALVAATIALTQYDIKKVLAYSTVSQLGFMFIAAGAGAFAVALFHVVTHAFFKACLFLGAGSVIHGCHHEQDMRQLGGLRKHMPVTCVTFALAGLALAGVYPFAGYFSKHAIFQALEESANPYLLNLREIFGLTAEIAAICTAFYITRAFVLTFLGGYRGHAEPHESPWSMTFPLVVLAALSVVGGLIVAWPVRLLAEHFFHAHFELHAEIVQGVAGSWAAFLGVGCALLFYLKWTHVPSQVFSACGALSRLFSARYYLDEIYGALIVRPLEAFSRYLARFVDQYLIDGAVNDSAWVVYRCGTLLRFVQTGQLRAYVFLMFLGVGLLLIFSWWA